MFKLHALTIENALHNGEEEGGGSKTCQKKVLRIF